MSYQCKCGATVPDQRVKYLQKFNLPITCVLHSPTEKVVGFQVIGGKTERFIEICTPEQGAHLNKLSRRTGTGVSQGVKMDQGFKPKLFK